MLTPAVMHELVVAGATPAELALLFQRDYVYRTATFEDDKRQAAYRLRQGLAVFGVSLP